MPPIETLDRPADAATEALPADVLPADPGAAVPSPPARLSPADAADRATGKRRELLRMAAQVEAELNAARIAAAAAVASIVARAPAVAELVVTIDESEGDRELCDRLAAMAKEVSELGGLGHGLNVACQEARAKAEQHVTAMYRRAAAAK